jgi:hypothetical protein
VFAELVDSGEHTADRALFYRWHGIVDSGKECFQAIDCFTLYDVDNVGIARLKAENHLKAMTSAVFDD